MDKIQGGAVKQVYTINPARAISILDGNGYTTHDLTFGNGMFSAYGGGGGFADVVTAWQDAQTTLIHAGGKSNVVPVGSGLGGATAAGLTLLTTHASATRPNLIRQPGYIWGAKVQVRQVGVGMTIKFKVFRINGANYDMVGESETFDVQAGVGLQSFTFTQPIRCEATDICGVWVKGSATAGNRVLLEYGSLPNGTVRYVVGDITTSDAFASTVAATILGLELMCHPPYLAVSGDSIPEGHNTVNRWHGFYDSAAFGIGGTITSEIMNQMRGLIGDGTLLQYQNHALGSQTYVWVAATGAISAIATGAKIIWILAGVNDIAGARTWANIEADLNTIKAALSAGQQLYIGEITPWTSGTDANAATVRTFNANFAIWCATNGAKLIHCHDAMGQIRPSTGELDDLLTAYNHDGTHLTQAGVDKMSTLLLAALS